MANQLYSYKPASSYVAGSASRSEAADYLSGGSIAAKYSSTELLATSSSMQYNLHHNYYVTPVQPYVPPAVDSVAAHASSAEPLYGSLKRNLSESLYHQTLLGAYNKIGQTEAWYPSDPLAKRTRYESTSHLPIYPQRPGEKDCAFYMQTRTCKFGESCKFDHPIQVPEGGIPDWKEVPPVLSSELLPARPGMPDCPHFLKTQNCKFGIRCKFNHPNKDKIETPGAAVGTATTTSSSPSSLPERPSEPHCAFYMKTGKCKFGSACKFHHPKGLQMQLSSAGAESQLQAKILAVTKPVQPSFTPSVLYNTKGLPIRMGEEDCPFYLKAGSCKYGVTCRFSHPETSYLPINVNPIAAAIGSSSTLLTSPSLSAYYNPSIGSSAASLLSTYNPRPTQTPLGVGHSLYPQRPGQPPCDYYMKHGTCKFGDNCKFHHPIDRSAPTSSIKEASPQQQNNFRLTLAGLPRREGTINCPYYMKTGTCKFGSTCKFDHPTPGEVLALAATTSNSTDVAEGDEQHNGESAL